MASCVDGIMCGSHATMADNASVGKMNVKPEDHVRYHME